MKTFEQIYFSYNANPIKVQIMIMENGHHTAYLANTHKKGLCKYNNKRIKDYADVSLVDGSLNRRATLPHRGYLYHC